MAVESHFVCAAEVRTTGCSIPVTQEIQSGGRAASSNSNCPGPLVQSHGQPFRETRDRAALPVLPGLPAENQLEGSDGYCGSGEKTDGNGEAGGGEELKAGFPVQHGREGVSSASVFIAAVFLCPGTVLPQSVQKEPVAVVELGVAPGWNLKDGQSSIGPTVAVEVTPIENWLELEAGVTASFAHHSTEWDTDLLFKKPWTLSNKVEFMFGVGPVWIHTRESSMARNSVGAEAVLDFMLWPSRKHRFGWYLEPGYQYNFGRGHEQSIGISGGLLIAIR